MSLQESVHTHMTIVDDRRLFIEAAVVRIMKARRQLKHSVLIQEVNTTRLLAYLSTRVRGLSTGYTALLT